MSAFAGVDNASTPAPDTSLDKVVLTRANGTAFMQYARQPARLEPALEERRVERLGDCCGYRSTSAPARRWSRARSRSTTARPSRRNAC
ncbi:MAG: hypothetical protein U1F25_03315 [Rubrivivax sp.]